MTTIFIIAMIASAVFAIITFFTLLHKGNKGYGSYEEGIVVTVLLLNFITCTVLFGYVQSHFFPVK